MDKDTLMRRLMATFLAELEDHVRTLNRDLLALEKEPGGTGQSERFKSLFRAAHSLKGAARSVNVEEIEDACHRMEEILVAARDGRAPLDAESLALLLTMTDGIEEAGMRLREQRDLSDSPLVALLGRLGGGGGAAAPGAGNGPETAPALPARRPPAGAAPPAEASGGPAVPAPAEPAAERAGEGAAARPAPELSGGGAAVVRVPAEKLDALLTHSSEVLVARLRLESRMEELATVRDFVGRWNAEWRSARERLRRLLPRDGQAADCGLLPRREAQMIGRVGEYLTWLERELERIAAALDADRHQIARTSGRLDEEVRHARMLPFAEACQGLERIVRDTARATGKAVELIIRGGDVEMDRSVLEGLKDPLVHLVRNAIDHGLEAPDRRRQAGKPPTGRVTVAAALRGAQVEVVVADDGRGLDLEALRQQARRRGITAPLAGRDLADLIFLPGMSTAPIVTNISGRGVGLDVVKSRLEGLHGAIDLTSEPGHGTRFVLAVPLTLTILRALLMAAGGQIYALASTNVQTLVRVASGDVRTVGSRDVLLLGGAPVPVAGMAEALGLRAPEAARAGAKRPAVVVAAGEKRMAFVVDELLAEQEVVVKGLGPRLPRVPNVSGATILSSGRIALVLNAAGLVRTAQARTPGAALARAAVAAAAVSPKKRLLVVDDSVTTRTLEKGILEAAGFEVATAVDGEDGWRRLQEQGADLLISDVEMPRMDGFALTRAVRGSSRFHDLPVVLLTSLASEADRARGIDVGADAYIIKGAFDQQDLVKTIRQLL